MMIIIQSYIELNIPVICNVTMKVVMLLLHSEYVCIIHIYL